MGEREGRQRREIDLNEVATESSSPALALQIHLGIGRQTSGGARAIQDVAHVLKRATMLLLFTRMQVMAFGAMTNRLLSDMYTRRRKKKKLAARSRSRSNCHLLRRFFRTGVQKFASSPHKKYMPGGSLYDYLHDEDKNKIITVPQLLEFAIDVSKGMEYLHQENIIHRDLKTKNLLLDANNVVKVADFGTARFLDRMGHMTGETGTYRWMAPEIAAHEPYDEKADVYSFAIVLWELMTRKVPYSCLNPVQAAFAVRQGKRPEIPENAHPGLLALMQRCWDAEPASRPSFSEIRVELETILQNFRKILNPMPATKQITYTNNLTGDFDDF